MRGIENRQGRRTAAEDLAYVLGEHAAEGVTPRDALEMTTADLMADASDDDTRAMAQCGLHRFYVCAWQGFWSQVPNVGVMIDGGR